MSRRPRTASSVAALDAFNPKRAVHPPGVIPATKELAMDQDLSAYSAWSQASVASIFAEGQAFLGYPLLAEMAQRPEYRRIVETIALHMTRKWVEFKAKGDEGELAKDKVSDKDERDARDDLNDDTEELGQDKFPAELEDAEKEEVEVGEAEAVEGEAKVEERDAEKEASKKKAAEKAEKIAKIEEELTRLNVREVFQKIAAQDGFFGRAHLYIDTGATDDPDELVLPIGDGQDLITQAKMANAGADYIKGLRPVEAVWCYPTNYNSNDPLKADWYNPSTWFVMGKQIHKSRLLTFVGREVPDLLKPAYSFGGLALTQMCKPYVDNWLQTRQSVSDIISAFSQFVLKTNLTDSIQTSGDELFARLEFFNNVRDNRGIMAIDKTDEDFANVAAPLGTLDKLQAQSQEQMASVAGIPLVLLLMITPSGLNASSEGEIQAFYDWVNSYQEDLFRAHLNTIVNMIQVCVWGEVDPDISFTFAPLWGLNELEVAQQQKAEAETDAAYVNAGILHPEESRARLAADANSPYHGIDVQDVPEPPEPDMSGLLGMEGAPGEPGQPGKPGAPAEEAG